MGLENLPKTDLTLAKANVAWLGWVLGPVRWTALYVVVRLIGSRACQKMLPVYGKD